MTEVDLILQASYFDKIVAEMPTKERLECQYAVWELMDKLGVGEKTAKAFFTCAALRAQDISRKVK